VITVNRIVGLAIPGESQCLISFPVRLSAAPSGQLSAGHGGLADAGRGHLCHPVMRQVLLTAQRVLPPARASGQTVS
jgi:hypothetical protein